MDTPAKQTQRRPPADVDTTNPEAMLHGKAVQRLAGISDATLRRWVARGIFPGPMVRIYGRPRWRCGEVLEWLREPRKQF